MNFKFWKRKEIKEYMPDDRKYTIAELEVIQKQREHDVWNQVLRVLGLAVIIFLYIIFAFGALLPLITTPSVYDNLLANMQSNYKIMYNIFGVDEGWQVFFAIMFSVIFILVTGFVIFILTYNIRDLISVIKRFMEIGKDVTKNVSETTIDSFNKGIRDSGNTDLAGKHRKSLFDDEDNASEPGIKSSTSAVKETAKLDKEVETDSNKNTVKNINDLSMADLDNVLKGNIDLKSLIKDPTQTEVPDKKLF